MPIVILQITVNIVLLVCFPWWAYT